MNILGTIGPYTVFSVPDEHIEPGHQWIGINNSGIEAAYALAVLTGAEPHADQETAIIDGVFCRLAPHDIAADQRLRDLLNLCADIRIKAPDLMQLRIEGWDDERPA